MDKKTKKLAWQISLVLGLIIEIVIIVGIIVSIINTGEFVVDVFKVPGEEAWALKIKAANFVDVIQIVVLFVIAIWVYIAYLKQRTIDVSKSVVDEKIKTHSLIECLKEGIIVLTPADTVLIMNKKAAEIIGIDETTILTQSIHNFVSSELQELIKSGHSGEKDGTIVASGKKVRMSLVVLPPNQDGESNKLLYILEAETFQGKTVAIETQNLLVTSYLQYAENLLLSLLNKPQLETQSLLAICAAKAVISSVNLKNETTAGEKLESESVTLKTLLMEAIGYFSMFDVKFEYPAIDENLKVRIKQNEANLALHMILLNAIYRVLMAPDLKKQIAIKIAPMGGNIGVAIIDGATTPSSDDFNQLFEPQYVKSPPKAFFLNLYLAKELLSKWNATLTASAHIDRGALFTIMFNAA